MSSPPGHDPGHDAGLAWGDLIAALIEAHGTLTAVAWRLVELADGDDVASVERALRRLRTRGQRDGGVWGQRVLRVFGVPAPIEARLRWMGHYHSPFNDLPVALCLDQLRLWDRPPIAASRARVWLHLGHASCALRERRTADATVHVARVSEAVAALPRDYDDARIELALIEAFIASHTGLDVAPGLTRAATLLDGSPIAEVDRVCFAARLADQRAYQLNRAGAHRAALALYEALPVHDTHPFASYRRDAGLAYGHHKLGRDADALALAHRACDHAGDGGYVRLRVMGLLLVARIGGPDRDSALARARSIATRLGDVALLARVSAREAESASTGAPVASVDGRSPRR